jgi:hypothetical protein
MLQAECGARQPTEDVSRTRHQHEAYLNWPSTCTAVASEEKERYRNSRQGSRSRRRLLSSDSFRGEASGKGSSKGGKLANEDGECLPRVG